MPSLAAIPATQRTALIAIYDATGGAAWTKKTNWKGAAGTECTWFGVTCDGAATKVLGLDLPSNHLVGALPDVFASLPNLTTLNLEHNGLSGSIPASLGSATDLTGLSLWDNQLSGGIPTSLTNLVKLDYLFLSYNQLTGAIPTGFGAATGIRSFNLDNNPLTGGIPDDLQNCKQLLSLQLYETKLGGTIPSWIPTLTNLVILWLDRSLLTGTIPSDLGNLTKLTSLDLSGNGLTGGIPDLSRLAVLDTLYLYDNKLTGPVPASLGSLSNLKRLSLRENDLTGTIPKELGNIPGLTSLRLARNRLTGDIPPAIGQIATLTDLWLNGNALTGDVPAAFANLVNLAAGGLDLRYNALSVGSTPLLNFLNARQIGNDVLGYQTSPPNGLFLVGVSQTGAAVGWNPIAYQADPGNYDVYAAPAASGPYTLATSTTSKKDAVAAISGIPAGTAVWVTVRSRTSPSASDKMEVVSAASVPFRVTTLSSAGGFGFATSSIGLMAGRQGSLTLVRQGSALPALTVALSSSAPSIASVGSAVTFPSGGSSVSFPVSALAKGSAVVTATAGPATASAFVEVADGCPAPGAPQFGAPPESVQAGKTFFLSWSQVSTLPFGVTYSLEIATNPSFPSVGTRVQNTAETSALLLAPLGATALYARVRAVTGCAGTASPGPYSATLTIPVVAAPPAYKLVKAEASFVAVAGSSAPSGSVLVRNVGGGAGRLTVATTGGFFDATPAVVPLGAGETATVTLTVRSEALQAAGSFEGSLSLADDARTITTPVTLAVAPAGTGVAPGSNPDYRVRAGQPVVRFAAAAGADPADVTLDLQLDGPAGGPALPLVASVGPGGAWLDLPAGYGAPMAPGETRSLRLGVTRARRSREEQGGIVRTLLRIDVVGGVPGRSAILEVVDVEPVATRAGAGRTSAAPPGGTSFVVPTTVRATSATGAALKSDGWLRNESSSTAVADLFLTPDGRDGLGDASVVAATLSVPAGTTFRLTDLLTNVFATLGSGQVEVRSATPRAFSMRTTVESLSGNDPSARFGTEIPVSSYGSGLTGSQGEIVVPGVVDDAASRTNLILAETSGAPVTARVTLVDAAGTPVGSAVDVAIPAYGKRQVNALVVAAGVPTPFAGGAARLEVVAGSGRVVALATVIDNRSGSFSALRGRRQAAAAGSGTPAPIPDGARAPAPWARLVAEEAPRLIVPSVARLTGANNTQYVTALVLTNLTAAAANLTFTYHYVDVADGSAAKTATANATIPPRGSLPPAVASDVVASLFALTTPTYGWIEIGGDAARVVASATVSALVDPLDPSKGLKSSQVDAVFSTSAELILVDSPDHRFSGAEKTEQRRTNLVLVETAGQSCTARVDLSDAAGSSLGSREYALAPRQYLQINDLFGPNGVNLGDGPFQDTAIAASVSQGSCQLVGLATVIDNQANSPQIFLLKTAGPEGSSIGF